MFFLWDIEVVACWGKVYPGSEMRNISNRRWKEQTLFCIPMCSNNQWEQRTGWWTNSTSIRNSIAFRHVRYVWLQTVTGSDAHRYSKIASKRYARWKQWYPHFTKPWISGISDVSIDYYEAWYCSCCLFRAQFMHNYITSYWGAAKCIFLYLSGTMNHGILYRGKPDIIGYSDADWGGDYASR